MSISKTTRAFRSATFAIAAATALAGSALTAAEPGLADETPASIAAVHQDIERTMGGVPAFVRQLPPAALPGAWQELKDLEFSETALPAKTKALISLAVAAQIPCEYCIWADTNAARQAGATDEEIGEAVAMAALTRHWSTIFNGLQVDLDTFKQELGGDTAKTQ